MRKVTLAAGAMLVAAAAANADVTVALPGGQFTGPGGQTVVSTPLIGTLTGIIVKFNYSDSVGFSWAADVAATVDEHQWGGFDVFINGATNFQGATGAPNSGAAVNFVSGVLNLAGGKIYNNETAVVGIGNGYSFASSGFVLSNVEITLLGVEKIPAPGAMALLGLAGLIGRRRRA